MGNSNSFQFRRSGERVGKGEMGGFLNHQIITLVINYNSVGPWTSHATSSKVKGEKRAPLINEPSTSRPSRSPLARASPSNPLSIILPIINHSSTFFTAPRPPRASFPPPSSVPSLARRGRKKREKRCALNVAHGSSKKHRVARDRETGMDRSYPDFDDNYIV